jgi:hypothetical protein
MSRDKYIRHVFISICDLFTDSPLYIRRMNAVVTLCMLDEPSELAHAVTEEVKWSFQARAGNQLLIA